MTAFAETRKRVLGNLVKFCAQLRLLTPKLLIDAKPRNEENTRIVIAVSERMRLKPEDRDDLASCMRDLWQKGHVDAPTPLTGDNKVMDVDVTAITEQGLRRLEK